MNTDGDYPRVLIVNVHFSENSGSGTFLGRLFTGWPAANLATIGGGPEALDLRRCERHYQIGELRFPIQQLSNLLKSGIQLGPYTPPRVATIPQLAVAPAPRPSIVTRIARIFWRRLLRHTVSGEVLYKQEPSPQLLTWAREFNADVIYGHCSSLSEVILLKRLQKSLGLPMVLHFMDDWSGTKYRKGWLGKRLRSRFEVGFRELLQAADCIIAICGEMAEAYQNRYQRSVLWLPMPVELDVYRDASRSQWSTGQTFSIRYGGRVGWAVRESLADLATAIESLRVERANVVFKIATFDTESVPGSCLIASGVSLEVPGPLAELPRLQANADVLVICYDFDIESINQAKYSMPSKLADCLASGTPILVYAPTGLPAVEYARREGWGIVVDKRDPVALKAALQELMDSEILREKLGRTAKRLAAELHDGKIASERLRIIFQDVVINRRMH